MPRKRDKAVSSRIVGKQSADTSNTYETIKSDAVEGCCCRLAILLRQGLWDLAKRAIDDLAADPEAKIAYKPTYTPDFPVSDLPISRRITNALSDLGIIYLSDLQDDTANHVNEHPNIGEGALSEIVHFLKKIKGEKCRFYRTAIDLLTR